MLAKSVHLVPLDVELVEVVQQQVVLEGRCLLLLDGVVVLLRRLFEEIRHQHFQVLHPNVPLLRPAERLELLVPEVGVDYVEGVLAAGPQQNFVVLLALLGLLQREGVEESDVDGFFLVQNHRLRDEVEHGGVAEVTDERPELFLGGLAHLALRQDPEE